MLAFNEAERDVPRRQRTNDSKHQPLGGKGGRKRPSTEFERIEGLHDLPEARGSAPAAARTGPDRRGAERGGRDHPRSGRGARACQAEVRPLLLRGIRGRRGDAIAITPAPLRKSRAGACSPNHTAAFFLVGKHADAQPFYRQEKVIARMGLSVSRGTMAHLAVRIGSALGPIIELMRRDIRGSPVMRMDETVVQVLKEPGKAPTSESRMWVAMSYRQERPILLFAYSDSRSGDVAEAIVGSGFSGFLQTDGYSGYARIGKRPGIAHVGCWAHIRREFYALFESEDKTSLAAAALAHIRTLYSIERRLRSALSEGCLSIDEFTAQRKLETAAAFEKIRCWLHDQESVVPPQSSLGKAIMYALGQYNRAIRYVEHPLLTPDNLSRTRSGPS